MTSAPLRLFAATGDAVYRLDSPDGERWETTPTLEGSGSQCVAVDPHDPNRIFAGTFDSGLWRSRDGGVTWGRVGEGAGGIAEGRVLSVAVSPSHRVRGISAVYVGTEPSRLYRSENDCETWRDFPRLPELPSSSSWSFPPRPWTHHVRWIGLHHHDPNLIFAGIELGGVMRSRDGGESWEDRKPGSYHDSHAILTHPRDPGRVYEAAGGGAAFSSDAGTTWQPADEGRDRHYVWGLAVDPADPDLWYVSAARGAGEAHRRNGQAGAMLYRKRGDAPWQPVTGGGSGLPSPLPYMPYALLTLRDRPGALLAGMQHGELHLSEDAGDSWRVLGIRLPALLALSEAMTA
jgi:photosystem II stability/assembly factor-like uncharacterized protein